jgi:hypothetical protein
MNNVELPFCAAHLAPAPSRVSEGGIVVGSKAKSLAFWTLEPRRTGKLIRIATNSTEKTLIASFLKGFSSVNYTWQLVDNSFVEQILLL